MSERYPGGIITKTPGTPTGPYQNGTAPGIWTLDQQLQFQQQGIWPTAGLVQPMIEDVFSTYLYTGTGSAQTITNGIDLSTKGGLVWLKSRSASGGTITGWHALLNTTNGTSSVLATNSLDAAQPYSDVITSFGTTGFSLGTNYDQNNSGKNYASWTFRKQAKFFDVVTFTQSGTSGYQTINHNLGSAPGVIIIKGVGQADGWFVYHQSIPTQVTYLNQTNAAANYTLSNSVTSTTFNFNLTDFGYGNGATYVAYLFASNAGGFGNAGTDNVITCGSFTTDGSGNATVNLGYEPQLIIIKSSSNTGNWFTIDNMRGFAQTSAQSLSPNLSNAEISIGGGGSYIFPTATGFQSVTDLAANQTYIYIAIRRGPMKTPTTGTSVFNTNVESNTTNPQTLTTGFPVDLVYASSTQAGSYSYWMDRLRGGGQETGYNYLLPSDTAAEFVAGSATSTVYLDNNTGVVDYGFWNTVGAAYWSFGRAPGFFDEVCYTYSTTPQTISHNLGVIPEMIITKARNNVDNWYVYCQYNANISAGACISLNSSSSTASAAGSSINSRTSTTFATYLPGISSWTAVSYLFATLAGVSKVGSYTGTGGTQTINCGFGAGGARYLLVKRTNSTGNWYVFDSARGFTSSSSPYLLLNSTAAQVTGNNGCYADSTGFTLTSNASATVNINGASYIFLAIA